MSLENIITKIDNRSARLAVIGLGYVGLPVAAVFASKGFSVTGVEIRQERVDLINRGISPIEGDEPGLADLLQQVVTNGNLKATTSYEDLRSSDIILIDVETPVDDTHVPRYQALRSALASLGKVIQKGALVIIESTIAPGTMINVAQPILEENSGYRLNDGFFLGNCPERVMPGKLLENLRRMSRVAGGATPETTLAMVRLYKNIVEADLDQADWITAELVKTVENTYRDVQIAFANEVAKICQVLGGDVYRVRELVNKSPFRQMHLPGAGVGGHCIPKDPWLLAYGAGVKGLQLELIPAARHVNDSMPGQVVQLLEDALHMHGKTLAGSKILVLGYAYLENSDDTRNSPSEMLVELLKAKKAKVVIQDPYVEAYNKNLMKLGAGCDAVAIMVGHREYFLLDLTALKNSLALPVLVDGRHVVDPQEARSIGFTYRGIGQA